jgi:outer membrane protein insertion porin family
MMTIKRLAMVLLVLLLLPGWSRGADEGIARITVLGNVKIEEGVIRAAVRSREGGPFSNDQVREDLRSIFGLGYFTDVQVDIKETPKGKEVIFVVVEKPSIREIVITGNQKVKTDDIKEKMTLASRSILNPEKVKENAEGIRRYYFSQGYYGVTVESKIDSTETNEAVVTFKINEGPKGSIKKVVFKGNRKLKAKDMKRVMATKERNLLSVLTKTGVLDEDVLKNDVQLLTAFYFDHGYLDAKISEPRIDLKDPKNIRIEIEIEEGNQYRFGEIDFKGDLLTTREALFKALKIRRDQVYSTSAVRKDVAALTEVFANRGYAYAEVTPSSKVDAEKRIVDVTFEIEKKKQVAFERIQIVGNTKTRDHVVRREVQVGEGELYSAKQMSRSRERLKRTGYFKEVELTTSQGSSDERINLEVKVEEAQTGSVTFGVGYSSLDKVVGQATLAERNLFGMGYSAAIRFRLGTITRDVRLSLTDPYFLGYNFSAGTELYHESHDYDTYSYKIIGAALRAGKELSDHLKLEGMYKLENVNIYNFSYNATKIVREEAGKRTASAVAATLTYDDRDDFFNPRTGGKHSFTLQNSGGPLGGDTEFIKTVAETSWLFPTSATTVLNLRGKMGTIWTYGGSHLPIYEKFFVGGIGTVRGFDYGTAGPMDRNKEPLGAKHMFSGTAEWTFPMSREIGLKGAFFWDVGKGFDDIKDLTPLKTGVGFGLRWRSPFGPISIDIGFNPIPKDREKTKVIEFSGGSSF